jgi:hypothetical protein
LYGLKKAPSPEQGVSLESNNEHRRGVTVDVELVQLWPDVRLLLTASEQHGSDSVEDLRDFLV